MVFKIRKVSFDIIICVIFKIMFFEVKEFVYNCVLILVLEFVLFYFFGILFVIGCFVLCGWGMDKSISYLSLGVCY